MSPLPQLGQGRSPGWKRILAYFEGHRTHFVAPICIADALWMGGRQLPGALQQPKSADKRRKIDRSGQYVT